MATDAGENMIEIGFHHHITCHCLSFSSAKQFKEIVANTPKMTIAKRVLMHRSNVGHKLLRIQL